MSGDTWSGEVGAFETLAKRQWSDGNFRKSLLLRQKASSPMALAGYYLLSPPACEFFHTPSASVSSSSAYAIYQGSFR